MSLDALSGAAARLCTAYRSSYRVNSRGPAVKLVRRPQDDLLQFERAWKEVLASLPSASDLQCKGEWEGALSRLSDALRRSAVVETILPALERASQVREEGSGLAVDALLQEFGFGAAGPAVPANPEVGGNGGGRGPAGEWLDKCDGDVVLVIAVCYLYIFFNFSGDPIVWGAPRPGLGPAKASAASTALPAVPADSDGLGAPRPCPDELFGFLRALVLFSEQDHRFSPAGRECAPLGREASAAERGTRNTHAREEILPLDCKVVEALGTLLGRVQEGIDLPSSSLRPRLSFAAAGGHLTQPGFRLLCRDVAQILVMQLSVASAPEAIQRLLLRDTFFEARLTSWATGALEGLERALPAGGAALGPEERSARLAGVYNSFSLLSVLITRSEDYKYSLSDRAGFVSALVAFVSRQVGRMVESGAGKPPPSLGLRGAPAHPVSPVPGGAAPSFSEEEAELLSAFVDFYTNLTIFDFPEMTAGVREFSARFPPSQLRRLLEWYSALEAPRPGEEGVVLRVLLYVALISLSFGGAYPCDQETLRQLGRLSISEPPALAARGGSGASGALGGKKRPPVAHTASVTLATPAAPATPATRSADNSEELRENVARYVRVLASVVLALRIHYTGDWGSLPLCFAEEVQVETVEKEKGGRGEGSDSDNDNESVRDGVSEESDGREAQISRRPSGTSLNGNPENGLRNGAVRGAKASVTCGALLPPTVAASQSSGGDFSSTSSSQKQADPAGQAARGRTAYVCKLDPAAVLRHLTADLCKFATLQVLLSFVCSESRKKLMAVFQKFREVTLEVARRKVTAM